MGRRRFLLISLASVVAARLGAEAQQAKVPRIGVLAPAEPSVDDPVLQGFRAGLGELGYIEGRNIAIDYVFAHGRTERFPDLVAQLARRNLDVAVVGSTRAALDAKEGLQATSIVFVGAVDPVTLGLVASLARPGGNVTGLSFAYETGLGGKWVELLHAAVPRARRVAILRDPNYASDSASIILRSFERAGQRLGLKMTIFDVGGPDQIGATFAAIARDRSDAVLVQPVPFFNTHLRAVVDYPVIDCPECFRSDRTWKPVASCRTASVFPTCGDARPAMSTRSSRAPNPLTFPSSSPSSMSWPST
jgi:putative tryptophan/tyrosine transport system substrate-binding protein